MKFEQLITELANMAAEWQKQINNIEKEKLDWEWKAELDWIDSDRDDVLIKRMNGMYNTPRPIEYSSHPGFSYRDEARFLLNLKLQIYQEKVDKIKRALE